MFKLIGLATLLFACSSFASAGNIEGYHYEKPSSNLGLVTGPSNLRHGHSFGPIPTIQPLPPVPAIPALPTPRGTPILQTQTLVQTHPATAVQHLPATYLPVSSAGIGKIAQQYQPPGLRSPPAQTLTSAPAVRATVGTGYGFPASSNTGFGLRSNAENPPTTPGQPLRVPFGKQAIITFPSGAANGPASNQANGRQLHQYSVIEIIDNDIEQQSQPFLQQPFFDSYRAHVGASGTGAAPEPLGGVQFGSRSSANLLGQQQRSSGSNDAVALGSGGLGFIRLANGNVYLGSGSLGYVSGQQHNQEINEARTRTGAPQPDALHFGHGALGNPQFNRFFYRSK